MHRKVVVVTGASGGVGRAVSVALSRDGYSVALIARTARDLEATADRILKEHGDAVAYPADISRPQEVEAAKRKLIRRFGRLDAIVHCAFGHIGEDEGKSLLQVSPSQLEAFGQISIMGTWHVTRSFAPLLRKYDGRAIFIIADWGLPQHNILLTTSPSSRVRVGSEVFVSAKYAVAGLAAAMERSLSIPTTGIYPGIIASARPSAGRSHRGERYFDIDDSMAEIDSERAYKGGWAIPLGDVANAVLFSLHARSCIRSISIKPLSPDYDGLHATE